MKILKVLLALMIFGAVCFGQDTTIIGRMGMRNAATYHFFEAFQTHRGKWIYPDVGYIDFGKNGYWEFFLGGGAVLYNSKRLTLIHEGYLDRAQGPKSLSATHYQPWTLISYRISRRVNSEAVYFPYLPLNKPVHSENWSYGFNGYLGAVFLVIMPGAVLSRHKSVFRELLRKTRDDRHLGFRVF